MYVAFILFVSSNFCRLKLRIVFHIGLLTALWAFSVDILLHCAFGEGACNEEKGNKENLHVEVLS